MLVVDRARKEFGSVTAVRDVSFDIPTGTTFGLIGPNGAGKTTTTRMIVGIFTPDGGRITWNGATIHGGMRRLFGYLPEERGLYGKMSVREQLIYFGRLHGLKSAQAALRARDWIERLDLTVYADRPCSELSKGNQQKVQVACAALHGPELLCLDEPFSGLDPINAEMLLGVLNGLKGSGATLVLSSHHLWQLEELCGSFCIVSGGETRARGSIADLRAGWPTRVIRVSPRTDAVRGVLSVIGGASELPGNDGVLEYKVPASTPFHEVLRALVAVESITLFEAAEPSLHDIYLHTVGPSANVE